MKAIKISALLLTIVGSLNWGLVALFNFNLVTFLFGVDSMMTNIVYIVIALCAVVSVFIFPYLLDDTM